MMADATQLRLLVVDDEPTDAELIVYRLRRSGFAVEWSRVDCEADFVRELPRAQAVICDYSMPIFTPFRALELLLAAGSRVPFLLVSGTVDHEIAAEIMRRGAAGYLHKDRLERLGPTLTDALANHPADPS